MSRVGRSSRDIRNLGTITKRSFQQVGWRLFVTKVSNVSFNCSPHFNCLPPIRRRSLHCSNCIIWRDNTDGRGVPRIHRSLTGTQVFLPWTSCANMSKTAQAKVKSFQCDIFVRHNARKRFPLLLELIIELVLIRTLPSSAGTESADVSSYE